MWLAIGTKRAMHTTVRYDLYVTIKIPMTVIDILRNNVRNIRCFSLIPRKMLTGFFNNQRKSIG